MTKRTLGDSTKANVRTVKVMEPEPELPTRTLGDSTKAGGGTLTVTVNPEPKLPMDNLRNQLQAVMGRSYRKVEPEALEAMSEAIENINRGEDENAKHNATRAVTLMSRSGHNEFASELQSVLKDV